MLSSKFKGCQYEFWFLSAEANWQCLGIFWACAEGEWMWMYKVNIRTSVTTSFYTLCPEMDARSNNIVFFSNYDSTKHSKCVETMIKTGKNHSNRNHLNLKTLLPFYLFSICSMSMVENLKLKQESFHMISMFSIYFCSHLILTCKVLYLAATNLVWIRIYL